VEAVVFINEWPVDSEKSATALSEPNSTLETGYASRAGIEQNWDWFFRTVRNLISVLRQGGFPTASQWGECLLALASLPLGSDDRKTAQYIILHAQWSVQDNACTYAALDLEQLLPRCP
jgi:hypothetical protein